MQSYLKKGQQRREMSTMKVLYDYQIFGIQKYGGISRYFYELSKAPESLYKSRIAVRYHINHYLQNIVASCAYPKPCRDLFRSVSFPGMGILCKCWETFNPHLYPEKENQKYIKECLANNQIDLFHPTYYNDYFLNFPKKIPFILTVYDMIHERYPEFYLFDKKTSLLKKRLISSANHIIAISEQTKEDLLELIDVEEKKITVVPLANSLPDLSNDKSAPFFPGRYILFVGERIGYKNFYFFLRAITDILRNDRSLHVVCAGRPFNTVELDFFNCLGIATGQLHGISVNDMELSSLYKHAQVFVFPSLCEGFGIPLLEAFSCGCPVISSNGGSLPEVGGDAAIYIDPKSASEIRGAVRRVLDDRSNLRKELIQKGHQRLDLFSWQKTTEKTHLVYRNVLKQ